MSVETPSIDAGSVAQPQGRSQVIAAERTPPIDSTMRGMPQANVRTEIGMGERKRAMLTQ